MFSHRSIIAAFFISILLLINDLPSLVPSVPNSPFRLPVLPGVTVTVTQGNNQGDHIADYGSEYAFDFIVGQENFVITAAQGGTVIGVNDNSTIQCNGLDSEIAPQSKPLKHCWAYANFVLIADDDGKTAALHVHLSPYSTNTQMPNVKVGEHVNQGDPIGLAGTTGWSSGVHLHFQVESLPSAISQQSDPTSGWWWTNSLPITFSNPEVLAKDANGIPLTNQSFVVSKSPQKTVTPTPPLSQLSVYVNSRDGNVYALNASDGKTRWKYATGSHYTSPLQVVDGLVYFIIDGDININPNPTSTMYVLNEHDGTVFNHFNLPYFQLETGSYLPSFKVVNGNIYFSSPEMAFAVSSKDGSFLWKYSWYGRGASAPVVVNDVVYYVTGTAVIYAFQSTDGTVLWRYDLGPDATPPGSIMGTYPAPLVLQNTLYVVGWLTDNLYAINVSTHTLLWHTHINNTQLDGLQVANQVLYAISYLGSSTISAVRTVDGTEIWSKQKFHLKLTNTDALYCLGVDANGSITGDLFALNPLDGTTIWHILMGNGYITNIVTAQMMVYVTSGTTLFAFNSTNGNMIWQTSLSDFLNWLQADS